MTQDLPSRTREIPPSRQEAQPASPKETPLSPPAAAAVAAPTRDAPASADPQRPSPGPLIAIPSHQAKRSYSSEVDLFGVVWNSALSRGRTDRIASVTWSRLPSAAGGVVDLSDEGFFHVSFSTVGLHGDITVFLRAVDRAGVTAERRLVIHDDPTGPRLDVAVPATGGFRGNPILIRGRVSDGDHPLHPAGEVRSLHWRVEGSEATGRIAFSDDGTFSLGVPAPQSGGAFTLLLTAEDRNGHVTEKPLRLGLDGGPALSSRSPSPPDNLVGIAPIQAAEDAAPPGLRLSSPLDGDTYGEQVVIEGVALGREGTPGTAGDLRTAAWRVLGRQGVAGNLTLGQDGSFRQLVAMDDAAGPVAIEIRLENARGRSLTHTVVLVGAKQADVAAPALVVESPADRSYYRSEVVVHGRLDGGDSTGRVRWEVADTDLRGEVELDHEGRFAFGFRAAGLVGTRLVKLTAEGQSGGISRAVLVLLDDEGAPLLAFENPETPMYYRSRLTITGRVGNSAEDPHRVNEVASVAYQVIGVPWLQGEIGFDHEGVFSFDLDTAELTGDQLLKIEARDMNGDVAEQVVGLRDGNMPPLVVIASPVEGEAYGGRMSVSGHIVDPYAGVSAVEGIASVSYDLSPLVGFDGSGDRGVARVKSDLSFRFVVSTRGLRREQRLVITATGVSGNEASASLVLVEGKGDIPSFRAEPGRSAAVATWASVPDATGYRLEVEPLMPPGSTRTVQAATSPHRLRGLENGHLYGLRLVAVIPGDQPVTSVQRQVLPLDAGDLAPSVTGEYGQIRVAWSPVPGAAVYEVLRSEDSQGEFQSVSGPVTETVFIDTTPEFGRPYHYRVRPAGHTQIDSDSAAARTLAFPTDRLVLSGILLLDEARAVEVRGGYAYVAAGSDGLIIVDIAVEDRLEAVGRLVTEDACDVSLYGDYALIADGRRGLKVVDITNPREPRLVGSRKTTDARAVTSYGNHAYVADGVKGLKVIDLSTPSRPVRGQSIETSEATDLVVSGGYLYLADGPAGVRIYSLDRPERPAPAIRLPTTNARGLSISEALLVVADGTAGIKTIDVADPTAPSILGSYDTSNAVAVALHDAFAYVVDDKEGLKVIQIIDATDPVQFDELQLPQAGSVFVTDDFAFVTTRAGLHTARLQIRGVSHVVASCDTDGRAYGVTVAGDLLYVADRGGGLKILEATSPAELSDDSVLATHPSRNAEAVSVAGDLVYLADREGGLRVIDVSPLATGGAPIEIAAYDTDGTAYGVAHDGTLVYLADGDGGLKIFDVSEPSQPLLVDGVPPIRAYDIAIAPGRLFVASGADGLSIVDRRAAPVAMVGRLPDLDTRKIAAGREGVVFVVGPNGLSKVDVSRSEKPAVLWTYQSEHAETVAVVGRYAYVAEGYRGLTVLDVEADDKPVVVSTCRDVLAVRVAVKGDYAFVTDTDGVKVVRILIPVWLKGALR